MDAVDEAQRLVGFVEGEDAHFAVDGAGHVEQAVVTAGYAVGELELRPWEQAERGLQVGIGRGIGADSRLVGFVAVIGGVAFACVRAVCNVAAADEVVEFSALILLVFTPVYQVIHLPGQPWQSGRWSQGMHSIHRPRSQYGLASRLHSRQSYGHGASSFDPFSCRKSQS